ncbi:MAG TPA: AAA family ATPase [Thermoanaerobaculia bacterium]|nr:AAA family ATPase [Thermoanaerobaculia bacterium]
MNDTVTLLADTAKRGELHHAIILHGPSPDALRRAAIRIAKALNCVNGTWGDDCLACQRIERNIHPDVHIIEVGSERKMISVEQIRDLLSSAAFRPYEGRNKVFIIDPADALSQGGSNSLLKTLEEPTRDTTFILLTRSPELLLPTIRSRSQSIYVGGEVTRDEELAAEMVALLQDFARKKESAALLALATAIADQDDVNAAMALLAEILCDVAAGRIDVPIPRQKLLAAADAIVFNTRWLVVNADPRMLVEQGLAQIV